MKNTDDKNSYIGYGVAFGLIGGSIVASIVSMFSKSMIAWAFVPGLGTLLGIIIAAILDSKREEHQ